MKCENDLRHIVRKAVRDKEKGAVLFMDLDDFKHINDGLGHQYGDVLLQQVAAGLQGIAESADTVTEWAVMNLSSLFCRSILISGKRLLKILLRCSVNRGI